MKIFIPLALGLSGLAVAAGVLRPAEPMPPVEGAPAPNIEFAQTWNLDGATNLADLEGRLVVLDFWRTW